jgi:hypothetical protein
VQLLDPNSPSYLGKAIEQYKRPPAVFMRDMIDQNGAAAFGSEPGLSEPVNEPKGYRQKVTNAKGAVAYLVSGKWVRADGSEVK